MNQRQQAWTYRLVTHYFAGQMPLYELQCWSEEKQAWIVAYSNVSRKFIDAHCAQYGITISSEEDCFCHT